MKYLLDTDICVYLMKRNQSVVERALKCPAIDIGLSAITLAELRYGVAKSQHRIASQRRLQLVIDAYAVLPFDNACSSAYGDVRAELEKKGKTIGGNDLLIAAHALALNITLITNNEREYRRVKGLRVENWAA